MVVCGVFLLTEEFKSSGFLNNIIKKSSSQSSYHYLLLRFAIDFFQILLAFLGGLILIFSYHKKRFILPTFKYKNIFKKESILLILTICFLDME